MRTRILSIVLVFGSQINFAQNIFPTDGGNVGIGTTLPTNSLTIRKTPDQNSAHIYFGEPVAIADQPSASLCFGGSGIQNSGFTWIPSGINTGKLHLSFGGYDNGIKNPVKMTFQSNGNIGIGTINPTQKLDVNGDAIFRGATISSISNDGGGQIQLQNPSKSSNGTASTWTIYNMTGTYGNSLQFWAYDNLGCGTGMCNNRFTIMDNGNVGIGATNPQNKLDVNGTIHSREVKVDMTGWSDFVFKKEYNLPTLEEVEKHIQEKGHLANIPSEKEVLKNGLNLGEMDAKLLQKIEELTLYMIEMKKDIATLKEENKILKEKNK